MDETTNTGAKDEILAAISNLHDELQKDIFGLVNAVRAVPPMVSSAGRGGDGGYMSGGGGGGGWNPFGSGDSGGKGGQGPVFSLYYGAPEFLDWLKGVEPDLAAEYETTDRTTWWQKVAAFLRETAHAVPAEVVAAVIVGATGAAS
jgi:hypothetical protein